MKTSSGAAAKSRFFEGENLLQISMPMGGIGAGCICLSGYGSLQDFSIHHRPSTTSLPDGWTFTPAAFAVLRVNRDESLTRLVEGLIPVEKIYDQGLQSQGFRKGGHEGLPRFDHATFEAEYPFGTVRLKDDEMPVEVEIEGWSPFVPLDDKVSGIPAAVLIYRLHNPGPTAIHGEFSFHLSHFQAGPLGDAGTRNVSLPGRGVTLTNVEPSDHPSFGSMATTVVGKTPKIKAEWFRGGWFDSISAIWRQVTTGTFSENDGTDSQTGRDGRNGGSWMVEGEIGPGETITIPVILTWYFPNADISTTGWGTDKEPTIWHPWYSTQWKDAADVAGYVETNFEELYRRTRQFRSALASTDAPDVIVDAVASNLAILKSPTAMREEDGGFWGWEGCFTTHGSCPGTCTHVWNYAQALPHLFPQLERSLRVQELGRSMDERGHCNFRASLPAGPASHDYHAASDGQFGGILKLYRDWQIHGDSEWLTKMYPLARRSIEYCIGQWDPQEEGALREPHHNTYDIEFWGPDGMCGSIYLGALCAMRELATALGLTDDLNRYDGLSKKAADFLDNELFNGEYYFQKVQWEGLKDESFAKFVAERTGRTDLDEMDTLLLQEGPKYQYGTGCISDGVIGAWMADIYGVPTPLSRDNVASHLKAIHKHNFKTDLRRHACLQRPGYAIGSEPGLLLCTWPQGGKPTLPFVYSDEIWTGIEYQVASHLLQHGLVDEAMDIIEGVRGRYEGHVRNPFNEYECGSYYARALASYALVGSYSGFRYSAVTGVLSIDPRTAVRPFKTFFSTDSGFGTVTLTEDSLVVEMAEGSLNIRGLSVCGGGVSSVDAVAEAAKPLTLNAR